MPCYTRDSKIRFVQDVCPTYDKNNHRICHLGGCGDIILNTFRTQYIPPILTFSLIFAISLSLGLLFILQITYNFRNDIKADKHNVSKIYYIAELAPPSES